MTFEQKIRHAAQAWGLDFDRPEHMAALETVSVELALEGRVIDAVELLSRVANKVEAGLMMRRMALEPSREHPMGGLEA